MNDRLILGSSSPWRQQILRDAGIEFETAAAGVDEASIKEDDPRLLALLRARAKAAALIETVTGPGYLIAADQVAAFRGEIRGKPSTPDECRRYLASYGPGSPAATYSAVVAVNLATGVSAEGVDIAYQYLRPLPDALIEDIIRRGDVFHCAGGFQIEDPAVAPYLLRCKGSPDSIMGMPMQLTMSLLAEVGWKSA